MTNFIDMCDNPEFKVISEKSSKAFISFDMRRDHYHLVRSMEDYGNRFSLGQRCLKYIATPYAHSAGSFVTDDPRPAPCLPATSSVASAA
jgi:flavorubredoxin